MKDDSTPSEPVAAPTPRKLSRWRWFRRAVGFGALSLIVVLALHPVWTPWALRPILQNFGVEYSGYERIGYSRFALLDGSYEQNGVSFDFKRMEAPTAGAWLWARCYGNAAPTPGHPTLKLTDWRLEIDSSTPSPPEPGDLRSTAEVLDLISVHLPEARAWAPSIETTNGIIRILEEYIQIPSATWSDGKLIIEAGTDRLPGLVVGEVAVTSADAFAIAAQAAAQGVRTAATLGRSEENWSLSGSLEWQTNQVSYSSLFTKEDWPPRTAEVRTRDFHIPAELAGLDGYRNVLASVECRWNSGRYELVVDGSASPASDDSGLPPISAGISAQGNLAAARITRVELAARGLRLTQSQPVEIRYADGFAMDAADLRIALDLAQASGELVAGDVSGNVRLLPRNGALPEIRVTVASDTAAWRDWKLKSAALRCSLSWPSFIVETLDAQMEDGSKFAAKARLDLAHQTIESSSWSLSGKALNRLLPEGGRCRNLVASGNLEGELLAPIHTTQIAIAELSLPGLAPADVAAGWKGKGTRLEIDRLEWKAAGASARLSGELMVAVANTPPRAEFVLKTAEIAKGNRLLLRLESEARLQLLLATDGGSATHGGWSVRSAEVRLAEGPRKLSLEVALESEGRQSLRGVAAALELDDFSAFMAEPVPGHATISNLVAEASWSDGPLTFSLDVDVGALAPDGKPIALETRAQGSPDGIQIDSLTISGQFHKIVHAAGFAPLIVVPDAGKHALQFVPGQVFDLNLTAETNQVFWGRVAEQTGVRIERPDVRLQLRGAPGFMSGSLSASFGTAAWERPIGAFAPPPMESIAIEVELSKGEAVLKTGGFEVEGQRVRLSGSLPISKDFWLSLTNQPTPPDWTQGQASLQIAGAKIAPFQRYLPAALRPQGLLDADLSWRPGHGVGGSLKLRDAATLPLPAIGPIRDIAAAVRFEGLQATLENFSGALGDEPVLVTGAIALPENGLPRFEFNLRGTNVSLVRQPGMIVRADLDLQLARTNGAPRLTGRMTLRDSVFFQDLKLMRGKARQTELRYPFFQIDHPALSDWKLDVQVKGDRFLKARTPWFRGVTSADFQVGGTLGDPIAPGFIRVDSGVAQFPFGYLDVSTGRASVSLDKPHTVELNVAASGSAFDYSVTLNVEGALEDPRVIFSSSPSLNSQQILLMLSAGQIPREDMHLTSQQKAARVAMFLGKDLLSRLGAERDKAERLSIRSGENVTDQGRLSYSLEYRLSDRWSAVGEYDRFSAVNAGLKWKFYSK